jgi:hypothetical protein
MTTVAILKSLKELWSSDRAEIDKALRRAGVKQNHILSFHNELDRKKRDIEQSFIEIVDSDPHVRQAGQQYGLKSNEYKEAAKARARLIEIKLMYKSNAYIDLLLDGRSVMSV